MEGIWVVDPSLMFGGKVAFIVDGGIGVVDVLVVDSEVVSVLVGGVVIVLVSAEVVVVLVKSFVVATVVS